MTPNDASVLESARGAAGQQLLSATSAAHPALASTNVVRVGVIGYGYWGPNIVRNFARPRALPARRGVRQESRRPASEPAGSIRASTSRPISREVLQSPDIDAVAVVTPVWTHYDLAKAALENGKHVFVEKPFTSTSAQAEELIELAARKNLKIMVDHTFLFSGAVRKIRELVDGGTLGPLYYFDSTRVNLGLFQHDVSVVWDLAPHDLSIMDHLIGEQPEAVVATGGSHLNGHADMAFITIYFPRNIIAHINVNWLSPVKVRTTLIGGKRQDAGLERPRGRREDQGLRQGRPDHQRPGRLRPARQLPLRRRVGAEGATRPKR